MCYTNMQDLFILSHCMLLKKLRGNVTLTISWGREYQEFSKLIWSLRRLLYPFLKPDQNSVCCLFLNYVSLKHKCVGFRKLQISAFPYDLGKCNFNQFCLGWEILFALFYNTRELSAHMVIQFLWQSFLASQMVSNKAHAFHINATNNL